MSDLGKLEAKSEISKILVTTFARIKMNPTSVSSTVDKAIIKLVGDSLEGVDLQGLQKEDTVLRRVIELLRKHRSRNEADPINRFLDAYGLFFNRLDFLRTLVSLHTGGEQVTSPGPGRIDAFGNVTATRFHECTEDSSERASQLPPPVGCQASSSGSTGTATPIRLWSGISARQWALGQSPTSRPEHRRSCLYRYIPWKPYFLSLPRPDWPEEQFGAVDTGSEWYRRGAALYVQHCAKCHDRQEGGQKSPDGSITYGLHEIGTDPLRAGISQQPLEGGKPFTQELQAVAAKVKNHAGNGANPGEHRGQLDLPEEQIRWITTLGYVARPLEGIWATAPYLHNGSVPTLDDLLKPENERPGMLPFGAPRVRSRQARLRL